MRILLTAAILLSATVAYAEEPFASLSFEDACKKAKEERKFVLIDFYTTWCGPCKKLDRTTWNDEKVREWLAKHTIALKIDAEKDRRLSSKYKVESYPSILFLKDDGTELDRIVGYRAPKEFLEEANGAISGKDSVVRAKEKLDSGGKNDPIQRMRYADVLVQKGKYKEALEEYLWCFDHGVENSMGFTGVRLSFLLSDIQRLGQHYKPAIDALKERRDRAEKILAGKEPPKKKKGLFISGHDLRFVAAMEFRAINRTLDESDSTLAAYEKLADDPKENSHLLEPLLDEILDELIDEKRYASVVAGMSSPDAMVEQKIRSYDLIKTFEKINSPKGSTGAAERIKRETLDKGGKIYEALIGAKGSKNARKIAALLWINDSNCARKVANRLLDFDNSPETYKSLTKHALRAGGDEEAEWLLQRARKKLNKDDLNEIEELAKKIKKKPSQDSDEE